MSTKPKTPTKTTSKKPVTTTAAARRKPAPRKTTTPAPVQTTKSADEVWRESIGGSSQVPPNDKEIGCLSVTQASDTLKVQGMRLNNIVRHLNKCLNKVLITHVNGIAFYTGNCDLAIKRSPTYPYLKKVTAESLLSHHGFNLDVNGLEAHYFYLTGVPLPEVIYDARQFLNQVPENESELWFNREIVSKAMLATVPGLVPEFLKEIYGASASSDAPSMSHVFLETRVTLALGLEARARRYIELVSNGIHRLSTNANTSIDTGTAYSFNGFLGQDALREMLMKAFSSK